MLANVCNVTRLSSLCLLLTPILMFSSTKKKNTPANYKMSSNQHLKKFSELQRQSDKFFSELRRRRPTVENLLSAVTDPVDKVKLVEFAERSYPLVHQHTLHTAEEFLKRKQQEDGSTQFSIK